MFSSFQHIAEMVGKHVGQKKPGTGQRKRTTQSKQVAAHWKGTEAAKSVAAEKSRVSGQNEWILIE